MDSYLSVVYNCIDAQSALDLASEIPSSRSLCPFDVTVSFF